MKSIYNMSRADQAEHQLEIIRDAARTLCEQASMLASEVSEPCPDSDVVAEFAERVRQAIRDMEGVL